MTQSISRRARRGSSRPDFDLCGRFRDEEEADPLLDILANVESSTLIMLFCYILPSRFGSRAQRDNTNSNIGRWFSVQFFEFKSFFNFASILNIQHSSVPDKHFLP